MKVSAFSALAAFSLTTLRTAPASAYNYATHSRIAELAVRAMNGFCFGAAPSIACSAPQLVAPTGEEAAWGAYITAVRAAPAKLVLLKTGLPTSTVDGGFSPIPDDSTDTTGYPFSAAAATASCGLLSTEKTLGQARDLNRLNDFRIADLDYFPARNANGSDSCGLHPPSLEVDQGQGAVSPAGDVVSPALLTERVNELVLGWHAAGVDDHLNDSALWIRPTLVGTWGLAFEAASWVWEAAAGTILLPFALLWSLFSGHHVSLDSSYALARQYNPVDEIQGAIPGVGDIRDGTFTGLWHFESVEANINRFNDTRGMWYPGAGPSINGAPSVPGAFDVVILAATQVSGLSLNAHIADGPRNYGGFDKIHRTWPQWQAHTVGMLEWSPLHNLAAYGWSRFKSDPSDAVGLGWPLHAIGDACEPQHVTSTSAWGHRVYEDWVSGDSSALYLPDAFDKNGLPVVDKTTGISGQTRLDSLLADSLISGFRWWKEFNNGQDMAALIHDLAVETRQEIRAEGDWPFAPIADVDSTRYLVDGDGATANYGANVMTGHEADARKLLSNAIGASIAVLAVAAPQISNNPKGSIGCPAGQTYEFQTRTKHVQSARGPGYDQVYTVPGCGTTPVTPPPTNPTPSSLGIAQMGSAANCPSGGACEPNTVGACTFPLDCASGVCSQNICGNPDGGPCSASSDCASGTCVAGICLTRSGGACTSSAQCLTGVPCASGFCGEPNGELCTNAVECSSGECSSGHCGKQFNEPCGSSSECSNNNCMNGLCGPGS